MARIPTPLARRLDRLSRRAHRFHRWAHHPLCAEYSGELIRLGRRTRVCRGCTLVAAGALSGGALSLAGGGSMLAASFVWALSVASWVGAILGRPARAAPRLPKLWSRFLPAFGLGYALGRSLSGGLGGILLWGGTFLVLAALVVVYRRRGPDRRPCATCPERTQSSACRGFAPIVRRERAFRRVAEQWLVRAGR